MDDTFEQVKKNPGSAFSMIELKFVTEKQYFDVCVVCVFSTFLRVYGMLVVKFK